MFFLKNIAIVNEKISKLLLFLSVLVLGCSTIVACLNMILRPLGYPITFSYEIITLSSAFITSFALSDSYLRGNHIYVDFFIKKLPQKVREFLILTGNVILFVLFTLISYKFFLMIIDNINMGELTESLKIPLYLILILILFAFLSASVAIISGKKIVIPSK